MYIAVTYSTQYSTYNKILYNTVLYRTDLYCSALLQSCLANLPWAGNSKEEFSKISHCKAMLYCIIL